jgi:hypothetical protein
VFHRCGKIVARRLNMSSLDAACRVSAERLVGPSVSVCLSVAFSYGSRQPAGPGLVLRNTEERSHCWNTLFGKSDFG